MRSGWYPRGVEPGPPAGLVRRAFGLVEVDTTVLRDPGGGDHQRWVGGTPGFTFDVKAFSLFTGHPTPVAALPSGPAAGLAAGRVRRGDLPEPPRNGLWERFRAALGQSPRRQARRGAVAVSAVVGAAMRPGAGSSPPADGAGRGGSRWNCATGPGSPARTAETCCSCATNDLSPGCVDMPQGDPPPSHRFSRGAEPVLVRIHGHSAPGRPAASRTVPLRLRRRRTAPVGRPLAASPTGRGGARAVEQLLRGSGPAGRRPAGELLGVTPTTTAAGHDPAHRPRPAGHRPGHRRTAGRATGPGTDPRPDAAPAHRPAGAGPAVDSPSAGPAPAGPGPTVSPRPSPSAEGCSSRPARPIVIGAPINPPARPSIPRRLLAGLLLLAHVRRDHHHPPRSAPEWSTGGPSSAAARCATSAGVW